MPNNFFEKVKKSIADETDRIRNVLRDKLRDNP